MGPSLRTDVVKGLWPPDREVVASLWGGALFEVVDVDGAVFFHDVGKVEVGINGFDGAGGLAGAAVPAVGSRAERVAHIGFATQGIEVRSTFCQIRDSDISRFSRIPGTTQP